MKLFIYTCIICVTTLSCKKESLSSVNEYVLLKRIVQDESHYKEIDKPFNKEELIKISSGLIYYGVNFKVVNDSIFISNQNHSDLNYLYNIQIKSKDSIWFHNHILNPEPIFN